jgi:hypothetical protein
MDKRRDEEFGIHLYTKGPQVILSAKDELVGTARTLTQARRMRKPGEHIRAGTGMFAWKGKPDGSNP